MKIKFLSLSVLFIAIIASTISCKGEQKNKTEGEAAQEVKEAPATAVLYKTDAASSTIEWVGSKPAGKHNGTIKLISGSFEVENELLKSGSFVIDMNSITVLDLEGEEKAGLEGHLKGQGEGKEDHFFNVAKHPKAVFEITGMSSRNNKTFLDGNLTIKETKKNISFPFTIKTSGNDLSLETETFTINRTQWGVNYGSKSIFENLGDKFINDDIELKIVVKATKA